MPDQKTEAELLRLSLVAGVATVADAVRWADAIIQSQPVPHYAVIEVALAGRRSPADVISLLASIPGDADLIEARRGLLRGMLAELEQHPERGADSRAGSISLPASFPKRISAGKHKASTMPSSSRPPGVRHGHRRPGAAADLSAQVFGGSPV